MNYFERVKIVNEVVKTVSTVVIFAVVFYFIQQPGSILTREKTEEEIRRDRAKLLVEIASIDDQSQQLNALLVVQHAYKGHDDNFFKDIEGLINIGRSTSALRKDAQENELDENQCEKLSLRLVELREELVDKSELAAKEELSGRGSSYSAILLSISTLGAELVVIEETITQKCGI